MFFGDLSVGCSSNDKGEVHTVKLEGTRLQRWKSAEFYISINLNFQATSDMRLLLWSLKMQIKNYMFFWSW